MLRAEPTSHKTISMTGLGHSNMDFASKQFQGLFMEVLCLALHEHRYRCHPCCFALWESGHSQMLCAAGRAEATSETVPFSPDTARRALGSAPALGTMLLGGEAVLLLRASVSPPLGDENVV